MCVYSDDSWEFYDPSNRFQSYQNDVSILLNGCVQRDLSVNYTAGVIGKSKGFPQSLVAVNWEGEQSGGQMPTVSLTEHMTGGARSSLLYLPDSKRHPSTAAITKERHFQSPANRSRIRTCNVMYYNPASLITWDCASEIN